jgi:hypothetical protein
VAADLGREEVDAGIDGYLALIDVLDAGIKAQVLYDLGAFQRATGHMLVGRERWIVLETQCLANRWTFIGAGMTHARFLATVEALSPMRRVEIEARAAIFC